MVFQIFSDQIERRIKSSLVVFKINSSDYSVTNRVIDFYKYSKGVSIFDLRVNTCWNYERSIVLKVDARLYCTQVLKLNFNFVLFLLSLQVFLYYWILNSLNFLWLLFWTFVLRFFVFVVFDLLIVLQNIEWITRHVWQVIHFAWHHDLIAKD